MDLRIPLAPTVDVSRLVCAAGVCGQQSALVGQQSALVGGTNWRLPRTTANANCQLKSALFCWCVRSITLSVSRVRDSLLMVPHVSKSVASQHLPGSSHEHYSVVTRSWLPVFMFGWRVTLDIQYLQILSKLPGHVWQNNIAVIALICTFYP